MIKKNSILIRILIPVIIVMLLQTLLISIVLYANGTFTYLEDSTIETLRKNVENRSITLENMMVHNWSNIDKLENDIEVLIDSYLNENNLSINDVIGSYEHETSLLYALSEPLINTLRLHSSTGVYMFFIDDTEYIEEKRICNGLYYRDLDPIYTPADNSDILFLRGYIDIARKDKIQLDSYWSEVFTFDPKNVDIWRGYSKPFLAAQNNPDTSSDDISYWNTPHYFNEMSSKDSNECITYTRPLVYDGRIIAMIGSEMQVDQLIKYFPANELDKSGKSGYMLVKYNADSKNDDEINCSVYAVTGSYIKRIIGSRKQLTLSLDNGGNVYNIVDKEVESAHIALHPLRLYNNKSLFHKEQWALASIGTDSILFESSRSVKNGILYSSIIALMIGIALLTFIIRISTRPLISIVNQIKMSDLDDPIIMNESSIYEIDLLSSTINAMKGRRKLVEIQLREERERYLVALESTSDTFMEYNIAQNSFMLYYFLLENQKPKLLSKTIESFMEKVYSSEVCHQEDIKNLSSFLKAETDTPIEIRANVSLFSHITDTEPDGDYYWFLLKASHIYDDDGNVTKVIGTARQITQEKKEEYIRLESSRRDTTTGLYRYDFGLQIINKRASAVAEQEDIYAICVVHVDNFNMFEAYYGRVFCGVILNELSTELLSITNEYDVAVRLNNNVFIVLLNGADENEAQKWISRLYSRLLNIYTGENTDMSLSVSIDTYYNELTPITIKESASYDDNPVSVSLDISKEGVVGLAFDLFEHTTDTKSVINILLIILGRLYSLHQIFICSYDADFNANHVSYQWNLKGERPYHGNIERVSLQDFNDLESLLDENGVIVYSTEYIESCTAGVKKLLCTSHNEYINAYCCTMYENGVHIGRVLFRSKDRNRTWSETEKHDLNEITRIIAAHLSVEKSNSASRAKSEFLSRISHEIRTPMNAIIGMTRIARESLGDTERTKDSLEKIDISAKHLLSLINDVLEMSRIESGKLQIELNPFSMSLFISFVDMLMRPQIESKDITFTVINNNITADVIGDENRIRQVLVNLLGNASKFTNSSGEITFIVEEYSDPDDEYGLFKFIVKDTGVGISKEDQHNVFKAFEQADTSSKSQKRQGTGLGLAISSNIISAMGSRIELVSDVGIGSEFSFTLKLKLDENKQFPDSQNKEEIDFKDYFTGKKALLVEDNDINIEIAAYILNEAGIQVDIAKNGQEALDKYIASENGYYDAILMDIQMPVMDGLTATREIRKNTKRPDSHTIPIIAMTANAFDEDMKKSIESGMNGHVAKPIDNERLYNVLRELIGN